LSSRVVQMVLEQQAGSKPISFDHVEQVLALAPGQAVSLPGQQALRVGNVIRLRPYSGRGLAHRSSHRRGPGDASEGGTDFAFPLSIPGEVELGPQRLAVAAELARAEEAPEDAGRRLSQWAGRGQVVGVAAGALALPLAVRSRRPGDRFRPLGAPGGRKLQDFLVDRKVPRHDRDSLPLVVDQRDRIVWVVGQAVAEDFRVTDPSQGVLLLKVRRF
jgi:tRNA(Ile)-lysidine synthase